MKTTTATIKFRFTFKDEVTMETTHSGVSEVSDEDAITEAWMAMANNNFDRKLIFKTTKIEVIKINLE